MSLLDQLKGLDTSSIASARGSISLSVNGDDLQNLVQNGAAESVLGALGEALSQVRSLQDPSALLGPIVNAVGDLRGGMSSDGLPLAEFADAVRQAVDIVVSLFEAIGDGDLSKVSFPNGKSVGDMVGMAGDFAGRYTGVNLDAIDDLKGMIDTIDGGLHTDPAALVDLSLQLLLPFDRGQLGSMRASVDHILTGAASVHISADPAAVLVAALDVVTAAAVSGDAARLQAALRDLERARQNALELVRRGLAGYAGALEALDLARHLGIIGDASQALRTGEESVLEFMSRIKEFLAHLRGVIENATTEDVKALIDLLGDMLEAGLRKAIEEPINRTVEEVKEWVRGVFAHIPLRHYRNELTKFIHAIAQAIKDADLDRYAREARAFLDQVEALIDGADLAGGIQDSLQAVKAAVDGVLGNVKEALETIVGAVNAIAGTATGIIEQAAGHLEEFQKTVEEVATLIESIQFEQAGAEVIARVHDLRLKAEELLSAAPLPDALRPLVEQLIDTLDGLDFEEILAPVKEAASEFKIPEEILSTVNEILDETGRLAKDLITPELISSIDAEIQKVVDEIKKLDPSALLEGVSGYIDEAADFVEGLDPRPLVHELRGPFDTVLDAIDALRPDRLLAPVIDAYDSLLSGISIPSPESLMQGVSSLLNSAGEQLGSQLSRPLEQLTGGSTGLNSGGASTGGAASGAPAGSGAPGGSSGSGGSGSTASASGPANVPPRIEEVHAGDLIRMLGYFPGKLREALRALDAGAVGDVLQRIDAFSGGLARDLRRVSAELWAAEERLLDAIDDMVLPLGDAQIRAQLAIGAHFRAGDVSLDLNASMMAVASAGPGPIRAALAAELAQTREDARGVIRQTGGSAGATLEHAAEALERSSLARIGRDLDALLAALDPEPVAAELDALVNTVLSRVPVLTDDMSETFQAAMRRLVDLLRIFNPMTQAEKFLSVLDVLREELDLLNPRRLASELGEVHMAIRETVAAYDPDIFAEEVYDIVQAVADKLRSLDPAALLGDLDLFGDITTLIEDASPAKILQELDTALDAVGERLQALDLEHLVESVEGVPGGIVAAVEIAVEGIRAEVKALLESIRYASGSGSASVSVEANA